MAYLHCRFKYNVAVVENVFEGVETPESDIDFVTGDLTITTRYDSESYDFGTATGTTLSVAAVATDTSITVVSDIGMSVGGRISILLDDNLRFVSYIKALPGSGIIDLADEMPSAAAIGKNAVTSSQLEGTTDGTLIKDFKLIKASGIINKSKHLVKEGFKYLGKTFPIEGDEEPGLIANNLLVYLKDDRNSAVLTITNITQANPALVTVISKDKTRILDTVDLAGVVGMTEVNGNRYVVGDITGNVFELWSFPDYENIDSTAFTAYTSGGTVTKQDACAYKSVTDTDSTPYEFANNGDFTDYQRAFVQRRYYIFGPSGGQNDLISQVNLAANTQVAMDAIVDGR